MLRRSRRPRRRFIRCAAAGLLAAVLCAVPAAAVDGFLYSREIQVPAAGWVRVPLDLAAVQHAAPGGADLHVFAPGGGEVALRLESGGPSPIDTPRGGECVSVVGALDCSLPLPAPGQVVHRLTVDLQGAGAVGYRLYEPRAGTWRLLREGTWQRSANRTRHFLEGDSDAVEGSRLRLELYGAATASLRLVGWGIELAAQAVLFRADEPGRYTLAYGGAARRNHHLEEPPAETEIAALEPGPEKEQAVPLVPEALSEPGAPLGNARFDIAWTVVASTAKAGDLVRLELPDVVYANARHDLGDLRIALGRRQIPFFRWSPPEPAPAGGVRGARPGSAHKTGESEVEVVLPAAGLPLTELVLTTPGGPLRRPVALRYLEPVRRMRRLPDDPLGDPREQPPVTHTLWQCDPEPPLPCREALELPGAAPKILSVRLEDGDNPTLGSLDAAVWRRRDVLLFVWPGTPGNTAKGDVVKLLAGSERLTAPSYDFAALGAKLLGRPWQPAELDLTGTLSVKPSRWARWALPSALALAGVFLLLLLRRILAER